MNSNERMERRDFEEWLATHGMGFGTRQEIRQLRTEHGYGDQNIDLMWLGWQARGAPPQSEGSK